MNRKNLFHGLVIILTLCAVALSATAQTMPLPIDCCTQASQLQKRVYALQDELVQIKLDYRRLGDAGDKLISAKEARLAELTTQANTRLKQAQSEADSSRALLIQVRNALTREMVSNRPFGWGRKRWVSQTLKPLIE